MYMNVHIYIYIYIYIFSLFLKICFSELRRIDRAITSFELSDVLKKNSLEFGYSFY